MNKKYEYIAIGSGPAGYVSAIRASQLGFKTAIIEKKPSLLGGVCLNEGCIPAKSLYNSAGMIKTALSCRGSLLEGDTEALNINMRELIKRSMAATEQLKKGLKFLFKRNGIDVIYGTASFIDSTTLMVEDSNARETISSDNILIASGSRPRPLMGTDFDGTSILSSSDAMILEEIPTKLLIVGGGAIGVELASYFNILGTEVTVIEMESDLLPMNDRDIGKRMKSIFTRGNIKVLTGSLVKTISKSGDKINAVFEGGTGEEKETFDKVIISTGRLPNTSGMNIGSIGVELDEKGFIKIDRYLRTSNKHVFAAGDVIDTPMLAHAAYVEGELAAETATGGRNEPIDYSCVPYAVYSNVKAAGLGLTEDEVRYEGIKYKAGKQHFIGNGRAVAVGKTGGFIKIIANESDHKILGAHIIGQNADEIIHEFVLAKRMGLTVDDIAGTTHAHPTFSETAASACRSLFGESPHG